MESQSTTTNCFVELEGENSELYQTYSKIFDQVRLERMEVSLAPTQSLTSGSNTLVLYSAVDRNFTSTELGQTVAQLTQASGGHD